MRKRLELIPVAVLAHGKRRGKRGLPHTVRSNHRRAPTAFPGLRQRAAGLTWTTETR